MRLGIAALLLASLLAPRNAAADEGLGLAWDDCRTGSGLTNLSFACDNNDAMLELIASFQLGAPLTDVIGIEVVVDVQHSSATLPDWWLMGSGACRADQLFAGADFTLLGDCADPWNGAASAEVQGYDTGQPRGGANQARIRAVAGVLPANARSLAAGVNYYGLRVRFRTGKSSGTGSCAGCLAPACLVLNGITIRRLPGAPGGDVIISSVGAGNPNWVTWRGGGGADCSLVPVRAVTWGRIKTLYR